MSPAEIAAMFHASDRLEQKAMVWLRQHHVSVPAMVDPDPVLRARIAVAGRVYFDIVGPEEDGVGAFVILVRDIAGEPSDIIAWLPKAGMVNSWLGAAACLGRDCGSSLTPSSPKAFSSSRALPACLMRWPKRRRHKSPCAAPRTAPHLRQPGNARHTRRGSGSFR